MTMKLAAVGSNCIDYYRNLDGGRACPGGGPVNMAVYTVRLGGEACYAGPVGTDEYGELLIRAVAEKGVDVSRIWRKSGSTSVTQVELRDGERVFVDYDEGVLADYVLSDDDIRFISTCDVVVSDRWGKAWRQFKDLKARGVATAFDCSTRPDGEVSRAVMPHTDYLFFSASDDTPELRERMRSYQEQGPRLVTATLGEAGSLCWDGERFYSFGIVPCEDVVDTLGAGDSYIAGFLYGLTEGLPIEKAMEKGAASAAETLRYFGAW